MADPGGVRMGLGYARRAGRGGDGGGRGNLPGHSKLVEILWEGQIKFSTAATLPLPPLRARAGAGVGRHGSCYACARGCVRIARLCQVGGSGRDSGIPLPGNDLTRLPGMRKLALMVAMGAVGNGRRRKGNE